MDRSNTTPLEGEMQREAVDLPPDGQEIDSDESLLKEQLTDTLKMPLQKQQSRRWRSLKSRYLALCIFLLIITIGSGLAVPGYEFYRVYNAQYHEDLSLAEKGVQHLQTAEKLLIAYEHSPLSAQNIVSARQEFSNALIDFVLLKNSLQSLPGISQSIPKYGSKIHAALDVVPLAIEASQAGKVGCDILSLLISRFHDLLNPRSQGLSMSDMTAISHSFQQIKSLFSLATQQIDHLSPSDMQLDPRISKLITAFHKYLPAILSWLADADKLLVIAPTALGIGTPATYLIEVLDSSELRPGGGFIGNYGMITFSKGREVNAHITDTDLLDRPFEAAGHVIPYPAAYRWFDIAPGSWSLRDSNLDADFPTAARYGEQDYKLEGGTVSFQGVIAITPALIQRILEITGPISVPEYHEIVTAQNLIDRIHYYQLVANQGSDTTASADGHSSQRKRFTALLAQHFLSRIHQLGSSVLPKLVPLMLSSLHSKDIQIYLNSSVAESFLQLHHLDGAIQAPDGDGLFVVDANIGVNKANSYIINTLDDQVTIDAQGNAIHRTTLRYAWTIPGPSYGGSPLYRDYVRVYVPPGSILRQQKGWEPRGTSDAFSRTVWAGFFTLTYGQTHTITLLWTSPGAAIKSAHSWLYQYLLQKQAGVLWTIHLHITLPSCAAITHTSGSLVESNKQFTSSTQSLRQDTEMEVDYTC